MSNAKKQENWYNSPDNQKSPQTHKQPNKVLLKTQKCKVNQEFRKQ